VAHVGLFISLSDTGLPQGTLLLIQPGVFEQTFARPAPYAGF
jgi:hypothetical protein